MTMNITGLASGMDVNDIIDALMNIARRPIVKNEATIEITGEIQELWRETNMRMDALHRSLNPLLTPSTFTAKHADSTNPEVARASVAGTADDGTYNLNVEQVASRHSVAMGSGVSNPHEALDLEGSFFLGTGKPAEGLSLSYQTGDDLEIDANAKYRYNTGDTIKVEAEVFNTGQSGHDQVIASNWPVNPDDQSWMLFMTDDGKISFQYQDINDYYHVWESDEAIGSGEWKNVNIDYTFGDSGSISVTVNGAEMAGDWLLGNGSEPPVSNSGPLYIGSRYAQDRYFQGKIGEVNLYKNDVQTGSWPEIGVAFQLGMDGDRLTGTMAAGYHAHIEDGGPFNLNVIDPGIPQDDEIRIYLDSFTGENGNNLLNELRQYHDDIGLNVPDAVYDGDEPYMIIRHDGAQWRAFRHDNATQFDIDSDHVPGKFSFRQEIVTEVNGDDEVYSRHNFDFTVSDEPDPRVVEVAEGNSLMDIVDKINALDIDVTASVVRVADDDYRMVLTSDKDGTEGMINAWDADGDILRDHLEIITEGNGLQTGFVFETQEAVDAVFTMNGLTIQRTSNTIDDLIDGVTLELQGPGSTTVQVSPNTEQVQLSIVEFVESYNETLAWVRALKDEDDGPLHGDPTLNRLERQMRSIISGMVPDMEDFPEVPYKSLSAIGIMAFDQSGILEINSAKLREALMEDAEGVYELFGRQVPLEGNEQYKRGPEGIARQMAEFTQRVTARSRGVISERLNYLDRRVTYLEQQNERLERRVEAEERRLLRQFTFMETYISMMMGQSGFLDAYQAARTQLSD